MTDELFDELLESVCEGGAILRGESEAGRTFRFSKQAERRRLAEDAAGPGETTDGA